MAKVLNQATLEQAAQKAKLTEIPKANPDLPYEFVERAMTAKAEKDAGKLETYDFD